MAGRLCGARSQLWKLAPLLAALIVGRILYRLSAVGELRGFMTFTARLNNGGILDAMMGI